MWVLIVSTLILEQCPQDGRLQVKLNSRRPAAPHRTTPATIGQLRPQGLQ